MYKQSQVAFIDTETTGLHPEACEVWEIAIIVDGELHHWQNRVSGRAQIDDWVKNPENSRFTTEYDKWSALTPAETSERLIELLGPKDDERYGRHLVGACPWFDSERLHRLIRTYNLDYYGKADHPWHYHLLDVECLALGYLKGAWDDGSEFLQLGFPNEGNVEFPMKSEELSKMIGVEPPPKSERHTAVADAYWAKAIFEKVFGDGQ